MSLRIERPYKKGIQTKQWNNSTATQTYSSTSTFASATTAAYRTVYEEGDPESGESEGAYAAARTVSLIINTVWDETPDGFRQEINYLRRETDNNDGVVNNYTFASATTVTASGDSIFTFRTTQLHGGAIQSYSTSNSWRIPYSVTWFSEISATETYTDEITQRISTSFVEVHELVEDHTRFLLTKDDDGEQTYNTSSSGILDYSTREGTDYSEIDEDLEEVTYSRLYASGDSSTATNYAASGGIEEFYRTRDYEDNGDYFWKAKNGAFGGSPRTFEAAYDKIPDGGTYQYRETKKTLEGIDPLPETTTMTLYDFSIKGGIHSVPDGDGGWERSSNDPSEYKREVVTNASIPTNSTFLEPVQFQIPLLSKIGEYADTVIMGDDYYQVYVEREINTHAPLVKYQSSELSPIYSSASDGENAYDYSVEGDTATFYYTGGGTTAAAAASQAGFEFLDSAAFKEIYEPTGGFGWRGLAVQNVALVQEIFTPGFAPFGVVNSEDVFNTYSTELETESFRAENPEFYFDMPAISMEAQIFRDRTKFDLSPNLYATTITKYNFSLEDTRRGTSDPYEDYSSQHYLSRRATVKHRWSFSEDFDPSESTTTAATLIRTVKDSDGFAQTQFIKVILDEQIPRNETIGHTIINPSGSEWIAAAHYSDATLHAACAFLTIHTVDGEGNTGSFTISGERDFSTKISSGIAIHIDSIELYRPIGDDYYSNPIVESGIVYP